MKGLLKEYYTLCEGGFCEDLLTESEKEMRRNGATFLTGKIQEAEVKNGNGRIYPIKVLQREIANYQNVVRDNRAIGSTDHRDLDIIELRDASHIFTNIWWKEGTNEVWGTCKVLTTDAGRNLKALIDDGVKLGMSSRALGSITESKDGTNIVGDDLHLISFDVVQEPSTPNAFMQLSESQIHEIESKYFTKKDKIWHLLNEITR